MRKRIIGTYVIVILLCGIYGCAQSAGNTPTAETENVETENVDAKNAEAVEEDIDKTDEQSPAEEKVSVAIDTDNPYFFRHSLITANAKYFAVTEGKQHEETVNAEVSLVKTYEEGDVYKFTIDIISDYFSTWYIQGGEPVNMFFYVTPDKIYLISRYVQTEPGETAYYYFGGDELVTKILDTDEKLVNNSLIVCQEEETEDNTGAEQYSMSTNNKENEHYSISKNGNQIFCSYYQLRVSGDMLYRDKFLWEKGKGLVAYLTGYGVGDYDIYLDCISDAGLNGQETGDIHFTGSGTDMW